MTKQDAGKLGGLATSSKYGPDYMRRIGKRGAAVLWQKYGLYPYQLNKFAMVDKETGEVKAIR